MARQIGHYFIDGIRYSLGAVLLGGILSLPDGFHNGLPAVLVGIWLSGSLILLLCVSYCSPNGSANSG